jgi:hypothetical protein
VNRSFHEEVGVVRRVSLENWRRRWDSNPRIGVLQTPALTTWLRRLIGFLYYTARFLTVQPFVFFAEDAGHHWAAIYRVAAFSPVVHFKRSESLTQDWISVRRLSRDTDIGDRHWTYLVLPRYFRTLHRRISTKDAFQFASGQTAGPGAHLFPTLDCRQADSDLPCQCFLGPSDPDSGFSDVTFE